MEGSDVGGSKKSLIMNFSADNYRDN